MTLNFSRRPVFSVNSSEDNFVRISESFGREGFSDRFNWEFEDGRDRVDRGGGGGVGGGGAGGGGGGSSSRDILDLLPSDPFGMNIGATFTALTGWIGDFEMDGLNIFWNNALKFQTEMGNLGTHGRWNAPRLVDYSVLMDQQPMDDGGFVSVCNAEELSSFCDKYSQSMNHQGMESVVDRGSCSNSVGGDPHEGLLYALGYMGVQELLSVESVCRSLHSAVQNDPLLWRNIYIDQPLSERIDDDALLRLTNRAQGNLHCLSLMECSKITDNGLKRALESNPKLTKLSVPGCSRLSVEGILNNLKAFKSSGASGLKHLRIGGRYGVTQQHFEQLKFLLGIPECLQPRARNRRFYRSGHSCLYVDDGCAIDIEMCPKCENPRLVYDCPAESCLGKDSSSPLCRGCTICIPRCDQCGRCINDNEYEETFCLDLLCSDCLKQEERGEPPKHSSFSQKTEHHLPLYG